jgi:FixJ family two-component response regulator
VTIALPVVHVVDDDASLRSALAGLLCAAGYEVRTYASAADFLLDDISAATGCLLLDLKLKGRATRCERSEAHRIRRTVSSSKAGVVGMASLLGPTAIGRPGRLALPPDS